MIAMNLIPVSPEIVLTISALLILLVDMFLPQKRRNVTFGLSLLTLALCAVLSLIGLQDENTIYALNNMFVSDSMSNLLKLFSYAAVAMTLIYSRQYVDTRGMAGGNDSHLNGEFYVLVLFSLLGQMVIMSGTNFLIVYLGIELMSLPLYALMAMRRDNAAANEAAIKYFILGALGSGFMLYGISMLYGATGSLDMLEVAKMAAFGEVSQAVLVFGVVFVLSGLAFKLGVVPFHMWVPDVYQGAPTVVVLLIAGATKLAAFALCMRLLVDGLLPMALDWQKMLAIMSVLSMAIGNLTALMQTNIKRMLGYSAISHMGFMLLGMLSGVTDGDTLTTASNAYSSALFYTVTYVLTTLGAFGVILLLSRAGFEADNLDDYRGLAKRSPWFALMMFIMMFSLAGLPPLMGFYAKLSVLQAVLAADKAWLAVVAVVFSLIGSFYYLRVIKLMYFDAPADSGKIVASGEARVMLSINGIAVLVLGLVPGPLLTLCTTAIFNSLSS